VTKYNFPNKDEFPRKEIEKFCRKWRIKEFAIFGSFWQDNYNEDSDIDVLIDFEDPKKYSLFDLTDMEEELRSIFGRDVDLVERRAVERSQNYIRKNSILKSAKVIYGA